uniref:Major capsid protein n=1 Tax=Dulem virus 197 TaxID=3145674 RepID=A0AAU8BAG2_9VIRU
MALDGLNRFAKAPQDRLKSRSRFDRSHQHKTTIKSGALVPIFLDEVLPGDTFDLETSFVIRGLTPIVPVMDNSFIDIFYFFVPNRLCIQSSLTSISSDPDKKDWERICGVNFDSYWAPERETTAKRRPVALIEPMSVANYFGLPVNLTSGTTIGEAVLYAPFVAYNLIWNEFFRDQNTQAPVPIWNYGLSSAGVINQTSNETFSSLGAGGLAYGARGSCLPVNKFHDYFTSCLPAPQRGDSTELYLDGIADVVGTNRFHFVGTEYQFETETMDFNASGFHALGLVGEAGDSVGRLATFPGLLHQSGSDGLARSNLVADLSTVTYANVNQLRQAFAIQRMLEKDARGGSRYIELLKTHFDVSIRDDVLQRPEYLGGKRQPLNVTQVLQTSATGSDSPLGNTGAFSNTSGHNKSFLKSFKEYGYIIGVACVRTMQSYSQGIPRLFRRHRRFDWYWPTFANLGEQAVYKSELYFGNDPSSFETVFGYQEAWAEYRYKPSLVTGQLAPDSNDASYLPWTYTTDFDGAPTLNSDFMKQPSTNVAQTLAYTDANLQYICDFYFNLKCTREMPIYSIPGLIDHH